MMTVRRRWDLSVRPPPGSPPDPLPLPPRDMLYEHALLVTRGVRPMALIGGVPASPVTMWYVHKHLLGVAADAGDDVIPFVIDANDGRLAFAGFGAAEWVVELMHFALTSRHAARHKDQIIGLLLGYSPAAIQRYEVLTCGAVF